MAKELVLNTLLKFLGEYVVGITRENFKFGLFSGRVALNNLSLNPEFITKLRIPVRVVYGNIDQLEINIPWQALGSQPLKVYLQGINLLVAPLDVNAFDRNDAHNRILLLNKIGFLRAEKMIDIAAHLATAPEESSFLKNLAFKIIDTLEIHIVNIHMRYEDHVTIPKTVFSCGLTLESFHMMSTSSQWNEEKEGTSSSKSITDSSNARYKLVKITNIGLYWSILCDENQTMLGLGYDDWVVKMRHFVACDDRRTNDTDIVSSLQYIVHPSNSFTVKLTRAKPDIGIVVDSKDIIIHLDKVQIFQAVRTIEAAHHFNKMQHLLRHRPLKSAKEDPRIWWKYALLLVTEDPTILQNKMKLASECCKYRSKYIDLLIQKHMLDDKNKELTSTQLSELLFIEEILPVDTLILFRQIAKKESILRLREGNKSSLSSASASLSNMKSKIKSTSQKINIDMKNPMKKWFQKLGSSSNSTSHTDNAKDTLDGTELDISITSSNEHKDNNLDIKSDNNPIMDDTELSELTFGWQAQDDLTNFNLDFALILKLSVHLTNESNPISNAFLTFAASTAVRSWGYEASMAIADLCVVDKCTPGTVFPNIVDIQHNDTIEGLNQNKVFVVNIVKQDITKITIAALPIDVCCSPVWISNMLNLFIVPENNTKRLYTFKKAHVTKRTSIYRSAFETIRDENIVRNDDESQYKSSDGQTPDISQPLLLPKISYAAFEISFEAKAPRILIPENCSNQESPTLVLDMGHLSLNGIQNSVGISLKVALLDVALRITKCNNLSQGQNSSYLIYPFAVVCNVQSIDQRNADMNIDISVSPGICGVLNVRTFENVLCIAQSLSSISLSPASSPKSQRFEPILSTLVENADLAINGLGRQIAMQFSSDGSRSKVRDANDESSRCYLYIKATLPTLDITMQYDNSEVNPNAVTIRAEFLQTIVSKRKYDSEVTVNLNAIIVDDTLRSEKQKHLVITTGSNEEKIFHFSLIKINNIKSPYWVENGYGSELVLRIGNIFITSDAATLLHTLAYQEAFVSLQESFRSVIAAETDAATKRIAEIMLQKNRHSMHWKPDGMRLSLSLNEVSVTLFKTFDGTLRENTSKSDLESIMSLDIRQVHGVVTARDGTITTNMGLLSMNVNDTRYISGDYHYTDILTTNPLKAARNVLLDDKNEDQIVLNLTQSPDGEMVIDANVNNLISCFSLDALVDVISVIDANVRSILVLVESSLPRQYSMKSVQSKLRDEDLIHYVSAIRCKIQVRNPQLILLQDPTFADSSAIVYQSTIVANWRRSYGYGNDKINRDIVQAAVSKSELFMVQDMTNWIPHQIINPTTFEGHMTCCEENGIITSLTMSFCLDEIFVKVSLIDIILMNSILQRSKLAESTLPVTMQLWNSNYDSDNQEILRDDSLVSTDLKANSNNEFGVSVCFLKIFLHWGRGSVELINGIHGNNAPLIRLLWDDARFQADGFLQELKGSGSFGINADVFNPFVTEWEPLLEHAEIDISFQYTPGEAVLNLENVDSLQLSVTSSMLETFYQTSITFESNLDMRSERVTKPAITFRNCLGVPITLYNSNEISDKETNLKRPLVSINSEGSALLFFSRGSVSEDYIHSSSNAVILKLETMPYLLDLRLSDDSWLPIELLSLHSKKPKRLLLQRESSTVRSGSDDIDDADYFSKSINQSTVIFWHCQVLSDGTKFVDIRSSLGIMNRLPFPVFVLLDMEHTLGPIDSMSLFNVPLQYANVMDISVKPAHIPCNWSMGFSCSRDSDGVTYVDVKCLESVGQNTMNIRASCAHKDNALEICFYSFVEIINGLPCAFEFNLLRARDEKIHQKLERVEEGRVKAGSKCQLNHLNISRTNFIMLKVASFEFWSVLTQIDVKSKKPSKIYFHTDRGETVLILTIQFKMHTNRPSTILVYSKYMLIDRSGLSLSVSTRVDTDNEHDKKVYRHSYNNSKNIEPINIEDEISRTSDAKNIANSDTASWYPGKFLGRKQQESKPSLDFESASVQSYEYDNSAISRHIIKSVSRENVNVAVGVSNLIVRSRRRYEVCIADIGTKLHVDRDIIFSYLPTAFRGQTFIATPFEDRALLLYGKQHLIEFQIDQDAMVFLFIDKRVKRIPTWMSEQDFNIIIQQCIACGTHLGISQEFHYSIYGRLFNKGNIVTLGCNYSADLRGMYSVCLIPISQTDECLDLYNQIMANNFLMKNNTDNGAAEACWTQGSNGLSLFHCDTGKVKVGVNRGTSWTSSNITIETNTTTKIPFTVVDKSTNMEYQLVYALRSLPEPFDRTKLMCVMPRYCIVNCTAEPIFVIQAGANKDNPNHILTVEPHSAIPWHKSDSSGDTKVHMKCQSTKWSVGSIDINEIGCSEVFLPFLQKGQHIYPTIINVEIKIAEKHDHCAVSVILWRANDSAMAPLSIRNESQHNIAVRQSNIRTFFNDIVPEEYEIHIPPGVWITYGWVFPDMDKKIKVAVGYTIEESSSESIHVDVLNSKSPIVISNKISVSIQYQRSGRIVTIKNCTTEDNKKNKNMLTSNSSTMIQNHDQRIAINFKCSLFGISVVADTPYRRELLSLYFTEVNVTLLSVMKTLSFECSIFDIQIDNYCETAKYPVLLRRQRTSKKKIENDSDSPFIHVAVMGYKVQGSPSFYVLSYVTGRILPFVLEIDSGSALIIAIDLLSAIHIMSPDATLASSDPNMWISQFSCKEAASHISRPLVDVSDAQHYAQQSKRLYENIIFHPIKLYLTFVSTDLPKDRSDSKIVPLYVDIVTSFATMDLVEIRLNSFIVSNAIESSITLSNRILAKVTSDFRRQIVYIAGSLSVFGSPAGFVRNIGSGVQDFFYEPAAGLVQSPLDFLLGVQSGTSSLVSGVLTGTLSWTAGILNSTSNGISYLSGDADFVRSRAEKRQTITAARGGALSGIIQGGGSIFTGIASGVTGIFTKPIEEAKRDGALGFVKGLGMGIAGVAVKPVLGITDGISTIAQGLSNEIGDVVLSVPQIRPQRALSRSVTDPTEKVLSSFSMSAAEAQQFVKNHGNENNCIDNFISVIAIDDESQIVLSEMYLFWLKKETLSQNNKDNNNVKKSIWWSEKWKNITCALLASPLIELVLKDSRLIIPCKDTAKSLLLYNEFFKVAHKFKDPSMIIQVNTQSN